jgi:hypothetical protein
MNCGSNDSLAVLDSLSRYARYARPFTCLKCRIVAHAAEVESDESREDNASLWRSIGLVGARSRRLDHWNPSERDSSLFTKDKQATTASGEIYPEWGRPQRTTGQDGRGHWQTKVGPALPEMGSLPG